MSEPTDPQRIVYREGLPQLLLEAGRWFIETRAHRRAPWHVDGTTTVPAGEAAYVPYRTDGDHHLVRARRAA